MKFFNALIIILAASIIMIGCSASELKDDTDSDLTVYTSIYPIQYAAERIGGETINAKSVYPPGVDAHTYEPTSREIISIAKGDAFIYLGAGMEGFAESTADALASQDVKLIEIGEHEELFHETDHHDHHDGHDHGDHDPHIWLDPIRMAEMSEIIKDTLIELNPDKEKLYQANYEALKKDLIQLDQRFIDILHGRMNKKILVSHAAYGYWEDRYGIEQISINGLSSSNEPSQRDLTKIIEQARASKLHYVIFEQNSSNRISEIIQNHIDAEALTIHNLAVLTEKDIENHADYLSLMEYNLDVLDKATSQKGE